MLPVPRSRSLGMLEVPRSRGRDLLLRDGTPCKRWPIILTVVMAARPISPVPHSKSSQTSIFSGSGNNRRGALLSRRGDSNLSAHRERVVVVAVGQERPQHQSRVERKLLLELPGEDTHASQAVRHVSRCGNATLSVGAAASRYPSALPWVRPEMEASSNGAGELGMSTKPKPRALHERRLFHSQDPFLEVTDSAALWRTHQRRFPKHL